MSSFSNAQIIVAHRGASHDAPENTLAAFRLAWKQGADGIEGDFYLSKDGQIVCIHDKTTERTGDRNLGVAQSTRAQLKQVDVGKWRGEQFAGESLPTLSEVIATVPAGKKIVIELKIGPEIVAPMKQILDKSKLKDDQIVIISFDEKTIAESKRLLPKIKAHWLTSYKQKTVDGPWSPTAEEVVKTVQRCHADGVGTQGDCDVLTDDFLESLKKGGVNEYHVWTIDDPAIAKYFQSKGAFGITTNRPEYLRRELAEDDKK